MLFSSKNWGKIRPHEILPKIRLLNQKMNLIVEIFNVPLCTMIVRAAFNKRLKIYFNRPDDSSSSACLCYREMKIFI